MSDEKKPFTVTDRRLFNSEGQVREEAAEAQPEGDPAASVPEAPAAAVPEAPAAAMPEGPATGTGELPPLSFPKDLAGLLVTLATQATVLMTPISEGEGGPHGPDLEGARSVITLIEVLQDKTLGRRTAEEDRLIEALLYELRMAYVAATRTAGK